MSLGFAGRGAGSHEMFRVMDLFSFGVMAVEDVRHSVSWQSRMCEDVRHSVGSRWRRGDV